MNNYQWNPQWSGIPVGTGIQTIGQVGCTISVIGNILNLTPVEVNNRLKSLPKDKNGFTGYAYQNLVYWTRLAEAFPGISVARVDGYNNDIVKGQVPNVICEVSAVPIGGRGKHWVQYIGGGKCRDPFTGRERPTSDFGLPSGYAIIIPAFKPQGDEAIMNQVRKIAVDSTSPTTQKLKIRALVNE